MEKKVLLFGYSRVNFGDDLFIYILANRYKNIQFYIHIIDEEYKKAFINIDNINFLDCERDVHKVNVEEYDAFIYIGGSIFIESEYSRHEVKEFNYLIKECNKHNKAFFYITCNFGPYETKEYLETVRENFSLSTGVCLRDTKSYDLFKDIKTVSWAPDIALTCNLEKLKETKVKKSIGISVINLAIREKLKDKEDVYNDYIKRIIVKFAKRNYKVSLVSFCEFEEDKSAIDKIKQMVPEEYKENVNEILYEGDIEGFIKKYSMLNYAVCTRFHSMILSVMLKQKIYNLCYSNKTKNTIEDFKLFKNIDNINELTFEKRLRKFDFKTINNKKYIELTQKSIKQFEQFEEWLNNKKVNL